MSSKREPKMVSSWLHKTPSEGAERVKRSQASERDLAKKIGGRRQPGSGNQWHSKEDVSTKDFLVQDKSTVRESLSVKRADLALCTRHAFEEGKLPAFSLSFSDQRWIALREQDFCAFFQDE